MGRAAGWEFFVTRWQMLAEAVSSVVSSARQATPTADPHAAARLDVVLKKAVRAKQVLQQLQEFSAKQEQMELRFRPVVQQLAALHEQLRPEELSQATEFALTEGMRQPIMQVTGGGPAAPLPAAQALDPWGVRIAFRPGHPLALLTWRQYMALFTRISRTAEQHLQGPALEAVAAFNRERKLLVQELQALRQQLEAEVEIPQLQPLRTETERLDRLLDSLRALQDAHEAMLRRDLAQLDLEVLELKLRLHGSAPGSSQEGPGRQFRGSPLEAALRRLRALHAALQAGQRVPSAAWAQLEEDVGRLVGSVRQRQELEQQLDVNMQRHAQLLYRRLAQLQQGQGSGASVNR